MVGEVATAMYLLVKTHLTIYLKSGYIIVNP